MRRRRRVFALFAGFSFLLLTSTSCIDQVKSVVLGEGILVEGEFRPAGPLTPEADILPFHLLHFRTQEPGRRYPLLLALHGSGDNGRNYIQIWQAAVEKEKIIVLAPTRPRGYENNPKDLHAFYALVDQIVSQYPVDPERLYLAGVSSGALVASWLAARNPGRWRELILIASAPSPEWVQNLKPEKFPPILFVHGHHDEQFNFEQILLEAEELRGKGFQVGVIGDPSAGHTHKEEWNEAILKWIKTHRLNP